MDRQFAVCYIFTMVTQSTLNSSQPVSRTQTGVRIATPVLKVLKGLAEYKDMSLGDLLEGIVLHAFDGKTPFSPETLATIEKLREIYGCDLTSADSHRLRDPERDREQEPESN